MVSKSTLEKEPTLNDKYLKIITEAFELTDFHILSIKPEHNYFLVYLQEQALNFNSLSKVEAYLKEHSDMLFIKWVGREIALASEFYNKSKVWIQA